VDDMQLMKDVKRFGLMKTLEKTKVVNEEDTTPNESSQPGNQTTDDDTGVQAEVNEDQEAEAEWLQSSTDQDVIDEDILESIL
jgi:hypothetical protein